MLVDLSGRSNLEKALVDSAADLVDEVLSDTLKVIFEPEKKYKVSLLHFNFKTVRPVRKYKFARTICTGIRCFDGAETGLNFSVRKRAAMALIYPFFLPETGPE